MCRSLRFKYGLKAHRLFLGSASNIYLELSDENPQSDMVSPNLSSIDNLLFSPAAGTQDFSLEAASISFGPSIALETSATLVQGNSSSLLVNTPDYPSQVGTS